jgi:transcriptional regulator with XRE-family HTH domain
MNHNYRTHKLRNLRRIHGLTQKELSGLLGLKSNSIAKLESGIRHPSSEVLMKLKIIFDKPDKDFIPDILEEALHHLSDGAHKLRNQIIDKTDKKSKRKVELLDAILSRLALHQHKNPSSLHYEGTSK